MARDDIPTPPDPRKPPPLPRTVVERGPKPTGMPPALRRPTAPGIPQTHAKPPARPLEAPIVPDALRVIVKAPVAPAATVSPSLPPPSQDPREAVIAALRAENEAYRSGRKASPAGGTRAQTMSQPPVSDEAIGKLVREAVKSLMKRLGMPAALVACLGGGGLAVKAAVEKPEPVPVTVEQLEAALSKLKTGPSGMDAQVKVTNEAIRLLKCMRRGQNLIGESLLPSPERVGAARRMQPWEDECGENPKLLPEP
jgi:hypothetical protein